MKSSTESSDPYRAYLDEEITGMGTLSGFCALALSAVLVAVQPFGEAWTKRVFLLPVGLLCTLLASLAFYLQRQKKEGSIAPAGGQLEDLDPLSRRVRLAHGRHHRFRHRDVLEN